MMLTSDERIVRERLVAWELRIQRILAMYAGDGHLPVSLRSNVRWSYASLKHSLKAGSRAGDSWKGKRRMGAAERRFYLPAVRSASAHLRSRIDAGPAAWHRSLCNALLAISDAVVRLEELDGNAPRRESSA
jgi:hypothetical protein